VRHPHGQTVTIVRQSPDGFDPYGDPLPGTQTRTAVAGCAVAPRYSTEPTDRGRRGVIVGLSVYAPAGTDILHTDHVEVDGVAYLVEGIPAEWVSPFTGWAPGVEVALRRAEG
jgi:hypothetical protein